MKDNMLDEMLDMLGLKDIDKYYVEYDNRLLYVKKDEIKNIILFDSYTIAFVLFFYFYCISFCFIFYNF